MNLKLIMKCLIYNFELFERIYRARVCDLHHEAQAHHKVFNVSLSCLIEYIIILSLYIVLKHSGLIQKIELMEEGALHLYFNILVGLNHLNPLSGDIDSTKKTICNLMHEYTYVSKKSCCMSNAGFYIWLYFITGRLLAHPYITSDSRTPIYTVCFSLIKHANIKWSNKAISFVIKVGRKH
jgi:hypothetical protein